MQVAFVFPGQGSQFAGMGRSLADEFQEARAVFEEADEVLGFALSALCFDGPEDSLKLTGNTQPALLTVSVAALRVLSQHGINPVRVAGHSLGEYSALVAAGSLTFADALRLVRERGRLMQQAVPEGLGAMAAILRLPDGKLDEILSAARQGEVLSAANYNSPAQIVIAGHQGAVDRALELARLAGARRAVLLPVSAPFHCELMEPAQQKMRAALDSTSFHDLPIPLINNWQAREIVSAADAREGLYQQIPNSVRWTESVERLARSGIELVIEVGAGSVLCGLIRQIEPGLKCVAFGEAKDLDKVSAALAH